MADRRHPGHRRPRPDEPAGDFNTVREEDVPVLPPVLSRAAAENILVWACLAEPELVNVVAQLFTPDNFADPQNHAAVRVVIHLARQPEGLSLERYADYCGADAQTRYNWRQDLKRARTNPSRVSIFLSALAYLARYAQGEPGAPPVMPWAVAGFPVPEWQGT